MPEVLSLGWLLAAILLFVIESLTINLITIWFAVGCAAALVFSLVTDSFLAQFTLFTFVSFLCLLGLKPLVKKLRRAPSATNGDRNLGRTARVVTPVTAAEPGRVRLDGVEWRAFSTGAPLQPGQPCRVAAMQSTTLLVEPAAAPESTVQ